MIIWAVLTCVVIGSALALAFIFNALIAARNECDNSFTQIDVQLRRRHDLIPQLLKVVRGTMTHERETLELVAKARYEALAARTPADRIQSEQALGGAISGFMAISERYPELKALGAFGALQEELASTENRIGFARQRYNDCIMSYDNARQGFPGFLIATESRFPTKPYWRIDDQAQRDVPSVEF